MRWLGLAFLTVTIVLPRPAAADVFGRDTLQGTAQLAAAHSEGLKSWPQGGLGKTRWGPGLTASGSFEAVWRPALTDDMSLVVDAIAQPRFGRAVDLAEGYLLYKPIPTSALRLQARAGLLYIPISLDHDSVAGEPWAVLDTITPSAINSWVGEELKALGAEGRVARSFETVSVAATLGAFNHNDTSGTLLALRGWAFSELVATAGARMRLPPLNDYTEGVQADYTKPVASVDGRIGGYAKVEAEHGGASIDLTGYDNNAELGAGEGGQWAWRTQFVNLGLSYPLGSTASISGQVMDGRTRAQLGSPIGYRFDVRFSSAYVRLVEHRGAETWTLRLDAFQTRSPHPSPGDPDYHPGPLDPDETYSERGSAALAAWKHQLTVRQALVLELMQIDWTRTYLSAFGKASRQNNTTLQVAYRLGF